jgi:hypothetical protein
MPRAYKLTRLALELTKEAVWSYTQSGSTQIAEELMLADINDREPIAELQGLYVDDDGVWEDRHSSCSAICSHRGQNGGTTR